MGPAESPLPVSAGGVSGRFEDFREDGELGIERSHLILGDITAEVDFSGVLAGHKDGAGGAAHGVAGVVGGELEALVANPINIGCLKFLLSVDREVAETEVIGEDVNDIGLFCAQEETGGEKD